MKAMALVVCMIGKEVVHLVHDGDLLKVIVAWSCGSCLSFFIESLNLLFKLYKKMSTLRIERDCIAWNKGMLVWLKTCGRCSS